MFSCVLIAFAFAFQVSHLLAALQQGSRGTQACINASSAVQGIVSDLDTTVLFAATGTLQPEVEGDSFGDRRLVIRNFSMRFYLRKARPFDDHEQVQSRSRNVTPYDVTLHHTSFLCTCANRFSQSDNPWYPDIKLTHSLFACLNK